MKASQLLSTVKLAIANKWAILIEGSPGIGKSDLIAQAISQLNGAADLMIAHPVTSDPTDYKGLPGIVDGKAEFLPYGELRKLMEAVKPLVCFIDDLGQGSQATQAALMQLVLAREINGQRISDHVVFIGATNRRQDNAGVSGLITPLRSRFRSTIEFTVDKNEWVKWAMANGKPLDLCAFISLSKDSTLNGFDPKTAREGKPFACPRTWAFVGDWINAGVDDPETINGCVGEAEGTRYLGFRALHRDLGNLPAQILANPQTAPVPSEGDRMFTVALAMATRATVKSIDALEVYFDRAESEFRSFFWKACTREKPELAQTQAHTNWLLKHQNELF